MGIHSFLDGVALAAGLAVGGGTAHRHRGRRRSSTASATGSAWSASCWPAAPPSQLAYRWLTLVAVAPIVGVLLGPIIQVPDEALGALLGFFAGFFLYVGAAELLPEAHRRGTARAGSSSATLGGAVAIYLFSVAVGAIGIEARELHPSVRQLREDALKPFRVRASTE